MIADPQRDTMFASAVYRRGGMTLQALREKIANDATFFRILKTWTAKYRYGTATTEDFIALSERISGLDLDHFFHVWLYTPQSPPPGRSRPFWSRRRPRLVLSGRRQRSRSGTMLVKIVHLWLASSPFSR